MKFETKLLKSNSINADFLFLISLFVGYIISSSLPTIFGVESRVFSIPYRVLIFFFSMYILIKNIYLKQLMIKPALFLGLFWVYYFIKTIYSFHTDYYLPEFVVQEYEIYIRILIINLLPSLAVLSINYKEIDTECLIRTVFWVLFIMLSLNLLYTIVYLNAYNKVSGIFSVYYISSGHFGASLVILSIYLLLFNASSKISIHKTVLLIAILLGFFAIYISASRGPILALVIVNLYFLVLKKQLKLLIYFFIFLLLSVVLLYIFREIIPIESAFVERNYLWIFEGNTSGREPYLLRAVSIFKDNILIGGRVLFEDGLYPHDIFLELLMAGGLIFLLLFGLFFSPLIKNINFFLKTSSANFYILPLFAIWLQYFILTLTSTDIHSNPEFWYFSSTIIGLSIQRQNEKT